MKSLLNINARTYLAIAYMFAGWILGTEFHHAFTAWQWARFLFVLNVAALLGATGWVAFHASWWGELITIIRLKLAELRENDLSALDREPY